mmetsp:Transcript_10267/g.23221  ORF Transcript_10267/g.23221 Transcript_10267/m.23221 type:complete len:221 (+) Transcript_10267:190-852(+)
MRALISAFSTRAATASSKMRASFTASSRMSPKLAFWQGVSHAHEPGSGAAPTARAAALISDGSPRRAAASSSLPSAAHTASSRSRQAKRSMPVHRNGLTNGATNASGAPSGGASNTSYTGTSTRLRVSPPLLLMASRSTCAAAMTRRASAAFSGSSSSSSASPLPRRTSGCVLLIFVRYAALTSSSDAFGGMPNILTASSVVSCDGDDDDAFARANAGFL